MAQKTARQEAFDAGWAARDKFNEGVGDDLRDMSFHAFVGSTMSDHEAEEMRIAQAKHKAWVTAIERGIK